MKKIISLLLTVMMLSSALSALTVTASAAAQATPIIYVRGNGTTLYNEDGKVIADELGNITFGDEGLTTDTIVETASNILLPLITEGLLFDKWDNYGRAVYEELAPLMDEATLDGDGNPRYGTGIHPDDAADNIRRSHTELIRANGTYSHSAYMFHYDWRLDPYYTADQLHDYITTIMTTTGKKQISMSSRCMGGLVLNAYIERYGHLGHIKNVFYGDTLASGGTTITKGFSGQVEFDEENIQRYVGQVDHCGNIQQGVGFIIPVLADNIINRTLDLFNQTGASDMLYEPIENLYDRLYKSLMPALFHAFGFASMPMYWAMVYEEDFDLALEIMFGKEGSEARTYYAGLIEKILYYREHVISKLPELYNTFSEDYGIHIGSCAKYGFLNPPILADSNLPSDALSSLKDASLGATTAKIGETLPQSYIDQRISEGKGEYISPDKQVDTSTCLFPETTWIVKNQHHGYVDIVFGIVEQFCNGTNVTIKDTSYPRFMIFDDSTETWQKHTAENDVDLPFIARAENNPTTETKLASLMRFFTMIFDFFARLFRGEIFFGK